MNVERRLWAAAGGLYGVGDLTTTWAGLRLGATERHPAAAQAVEAIGPAVLLPWTFAALVAFAGAYVALGRRGIRSRIGIPIGLAAVGGVAVANNVAVIAAGWSA